MPINSQICYADFNLIPNDACALDWYQTAALATKAAPPPPQLRLQLKSVHADFIPKVI